VKGGVRVAGVVMVEVRVTQVGAVVVAVFVFLLVAVFLFLLVVSFPFLAVAAAS